VLLAPAGTLQDDLDTFDLDFQYRFTIGARQTVTSGGGYRFTHDVVQNAPGLGFVPATLNQALVSGFVQDEITLSPTLALIAGTKIEHNDYTGVEAEPSARLRWTPASTQMLWSAVSRAVRMPARVDRDERISTPGLSPIVENLLIGGADFQSERLLAYELGYRGQIGPAVSSSVTVFHHRYDDLRSTRLGPPDPIFGLPFPFVFANDLEGDTTGLETSVTHQPLEWWRLRGAYTFLTTDIRVKPGRTDVNNALNENADPRHRLALRSSVTLRNVIELDAAFRWVGAFTYNNNGTPGVLPGYGELGMRLAWLPSPRLELSLVGDNLLHEQHAEYVTSGPNPRVEISRHVYVRTAVRW
jgi:iron complex outermembrane receptor protein